MDIKKYIDSGILENYVLGLVSEKEAQAIEQNVLQYPELKTELTKIEDALATYAQAKARPMPDGLSDQIMQSIKDIEASASSDTSTPTAQPKAAKSSNTTGIILGLALAGSFLGSFFLFQQKQQLDTTLSQSQTRLTQLNDNLTALQLDCDQKDQNIQQLQEQISILKNPAYQRVQMLGTPTKAPNAIATVYFNATENKTYLDAGNLPTAPADKDYQLWAIVNGVPTDMGIFDNAAAANGLLVSVPHITEPQAFAVTLETKGGNPSPNLEELYVIGNV